MESPAAFLAAAARAGKKGQSQFIAFITPDEFADFAAVKTRYTADAALGAFAVVDRARSATGTATVKRMVPGVGLSTR